MRTTLTATRIGHARQLIEIGGIRVFTDPWFTQTATYHQGEPVASTVEALGPRQVCRERGIRVFSAPVSPVRLAAT